MSGPMQLTRVCPMRLQRWAWSENSCPPVWML